MSTVVRTPPVPVVTVRELLPAVAVVRAPNVPFVLEKTDPRTRPKLSTTAEPSPCADAPPKTSPVAAIVVNAAPPEVDAVELLLESEVPSDRLVERF